MLNHLSYSVTFSSTGRTLAADVAFRRGFGVITGPNESGKSEILEVIRFCLFGAAALRGRAEDYKSLKAELQFTVRGDDYRVLRTGSTARLFRGDEEIATGVRAVNEKIPQLLGFGLEVFDVACVANQGDIERLGAMKPAERKRMVDSIIGVSLIDDLARWAGEEALALGRQAEAVERTLVAPVEPERPEGYRTSGELECAIAELQRMQDRLNALEGWLSHEREEPIAPQPPTDMSAAELKRLADIQTETRMRRRLIEAELATLPPPSAFSEAELDELEAKLAAWELWQERAAWLQRHPEPRHTEADLERFAADWQTLERWDEHDRIAERIRRLESCGVLECPSCGHTWPAEHAEIERLRTLLVPVEAERPLQTPPVKAASIPGLRDYAASWSLPAHLADVAETAPPALDRRALALHRTANAKAARRAALAAELAALALDETDWPSLHRQRLAYELALERYRSDLVAWQVWSAERAEKTREATRLRGAVAPLGSLLHLLKCSLAYEAAHRQYLSERATYERNAATAREFRSGAEDWKRGKAAMLRLRVLVKQHLLPSLNRVASHLIGQMTGGQRRLIVVDDEFDITVDGQPLATLSGSGKAVANLALRLGLGQVLTNNVLSLFVGDEIDASLDADRGESTAQTLRGLVGSIAQIVLVTHKSPAGDYSVALEP